MRAPPYCLIIYPSFGGKTAHCFDKDCRFTRPVTFSFALHMHMDRLRDFVRKLCFLNRHNFRSQDAD